MAAAQLPPVGRQRARKLRLPLLLAAVLCVLQLLPPTLSSNFGLASLYKGDPLLVDREVTLATEAEPESDTEGGILSGSPKSIAFLAYVVCFMVAKTEPPAPTGTPPKLHPDVPPLEKRRDYNGVLFMSSFLSLVSGVVNALAIIAMGGTVAHHTGNASHAGRLWGVDGLRFLSLMVAYLMGSALAGYCKVDGEAVFARRYSPGMLSGAIAVAMGAFIFHTSGDALVALPLLSFSQGIQNAITRRCGSLPVCTTHMTGYLTDAGCGLGLWARAGGHDPIPLRTKFFLISIFAFVFGGLVAKKLMDVLGIMSAIVPALAMAAVAFGRVPVPKPAKPAAE